MTLEMKRVFLLHEIVIEEIVAEHRPKAVSFSRIELVEKIRIQFLGPFEKILQIVGPIVFVEADFPIRSRFGNETYF